MSSVQGYVQLIGTSVIEAHSARIAEEAIKAPHIFFYGLLLKLQPVQALRKSPDFAWIPEVMEVLCYGMIGDLQRLPSSVQEHLTTEVYRKACKLSVLSLCTCDGMDGVLRIHQVQKAIQATKSAEAEELLIEMASDGLLRVRIDQRGGMAILHEFVARDVQRDAVESLRHKLESWCGSCDSQIAMLETLMRE